ncbi:RNA polymerase subunit sigma [Paenibacillus sp. MY03]|uniref:DNA-directed RNA polymerase subunit sigma n=1 Tax=Paenibacillus agaridevorans TaxID=171404 RepID=A0A2R5EHG6_9BACL|nr:MULTISPECIES: sigma-70 family RNA polymerase sigma factor [Paenibacillus]OUS75465.1 RNA polymerase subunit sigma [Paenibacillus sp. MY03]GBG05535.1 DNA-directed RNA polymerase subunit sigma [Paenibacillus agaridevorans]
MTDFEQIYADYFKPVYAFVLSLSRDAAIAEDITQETFLKAIKNIDAFKGECKMSVWLCQIAKNSYFTYVDKQKRISQDTAIERANLRSPNLEDALANREQAYRVHQALHKMDEPYKEVFTLRIFGELSFAQISGLFGKTESWARVTFYRAKKRLLAELKEDSP